MRPQFTKAAFRQGTYPEEIQQNPNNIVCTEGNTELLRDIFKINPSPVRDISFPPRECKRAKSACQDCLRKKNCDIDNGELSMSVL
jgi:hypothetical protein